MANPEKQFIVDDVKAATPAQPDGYVPGGAVGAMHRDLAARINGQPGVLVMPDRAAMDLGEALVAGFSRAMGPVIFVGVLSGLGIYFFG